MGGGKRFGEVIREKSGLDVSDFVRGADDPAVRAKFATVATRMADILPSLPNMVSGFVFWPPEFGRPSTPTLHAAFRFRHVRVMQARTGQQRFEDLEWPMPDISASDSPEEGGLLSVSFVGR